MVVLEVREDTVAAVRPLAEAITDLDARVRELEQVERSLDAESVDAEYDYVRESRTAGVRAAVDVAAAALEMARVPDEPSSAVADHVWAEVDHLLNDDRALGAFVGAEVQLLTELLPARLVLELAEAMILYGPRRFAPMPAAARSSRRVDLFSNAVILGLETVEERGRSLGPEMHERGSDSQGLRTMKAARWLASCLVSDQLNTGLAAVVAHAAGGDPALVGLSSTAGAVASKLLSTAAATARRKYLDDLGQ